MKNITSISTLSFSRNQDFLIKVFSFILLLNALKPWLDYYLSISNQLITGIQFLFLFFVITIFNKLFYQKTTIFAFLIVIYVIFRFSIETFVDISNYNLTAIISSSYFVLRLFLVVYILQVLLARDRSLNFFLNLRKIFISYFVLTVIYSFLQTPYFFGLTYEQAFNDLIMSQAGGNIVSANHLGFFRSSGGIGGTAIDYANYLLATSWIIFFTDYKNKYIKYILYILFTWSVFICFSRALFLTLFLMFFIYLVMPKNYKELAVSFFILVVISLLLAFNMVSIIDFFSELANNSDAKRIQSWFDLFKNLSFFDVLIGVDLGGNSGIMEKGIYKLSSDGFVTSFIYDAGLIAFILIFGVIVKPIYLMPARWRTKFSMIISLLIILVINSGFEKLFITMSYMASIAIVYGLSLHKAQKKFN